MAGSIASTLAKEAGRGLVKIKAVIACDASGDASVTTIGQAFGRIVGVGYKPGTLDTGVDITLKDNATGAALVTLTNAGTSARYFRPSAVVTDNAGAAVTAATTAVDVNRDIYVAGKLDLLVAQGGNLGAGELYVLVDEAA